MIISGYSLSVAWQYAQFSAPIGGQEISEPERAPVEGTPPTEPTPEGEAVDAGQKVRGENGVLRLLEEGHFKPHAQMRLIEIFHRDLAILQAQTADTAPPDPSSAEAEVI
jgi:hypothetical protein